MELHNELFQIKRLNAEDITIAQELFMLFEKVFESEKPSVANEKHLMKMLSNPSFIAFAITHQNTVIGGLTAYELQMYHSDSSEIFIYDIAIQPEFQRKGLGKKLLAAIQDYASKNGIQETFVTANEEDQHALDFYRSTGGKEEKVSHFTYFSRL